jgi:RNA polymerase sigma-70 factor (ECF subfamily)
VSTATTHTDQDLFFRISRGDEQAFTLFFHKYKSPLFDYAMKLTKTASSAEELVQDLFLKIWTGRAALAEVQNPSAYVHRMAKNAGIDYLRHVSSNRKMQQGVLATLQYEDHSTQEEINLGETKRILNEAVQQLTPSQKEVFYLSRNQGLSYEEIAEELGIARNTVKNHLTASLKIIRDYLSRHYHPVVVLIVTAFLNRW